MRVSIVKTGSTFPELKARRGDYEDWIAAAMGATDVNVLDVVNGDALPDPAVPTAVVVTGSSSMVTDRAAWSERTGHWLAERARLDRPTLAICYGHQLLADKLDGATCTHPGGRQMGSIDVDLTDAGAEDALFHGMPGVLRVSASHRQYVNTLPSGATLLATTPHDRNHAFRLGERVWAVQFHPEWDDDVMRAYLTSRRDTLAAEGFDPDDLIAQVRPSEHGAAILLRFAQLVG